MLWVLILFIWWWIQRFHIYCEGWLWCSGCSFLSKRPQSCVSVFLVCAVSETQIRARCFPYYLKKSCWTLRHRRDLACYTSPLIAPSTFGWLLISANLPAWNIGAYPLIALPSEMGVAARHQAIIRWMANHLCIYTTQTIMTTIIKCSSTVTYHGTPWDELCQVWRSLKSWSFPHAPSNWSRLVHLRWPFRLRFKKKRIGAKLWRCCIFS